MIAVLFLILFGLFLWTAAPSISWFDTGELVVGAVVLGNGHPPGHPAYALLGKAAAFAPIGNLPFRLTLLSCTASALAVTLLARQVALLSDQPRPPRDAILGRWMVGSSVALALPIWLQAVRVELYAVHLLLSSILVLLSLQRRRSTTGINHLLALSFVGGLALAVHPLLAVLMIPGLALLVGWPGFRAVGGSLAAGILGFSTYLYGPIRAHTAAILNWADPDSLERWLNYITGRVYQRSFSRLTGSALAENLNQHMELFLQMAGIPLLCLALFGWVRTWRHTSVAIGIPVLILGNITATAAQSFFTAENPDALGYLAPSFLLVGLLAAHGFEILSTWLLTQEGIPVSRRIRVSLLSMSALTLAITIGLHSWPRPNLREDWLAAHFGQALLSEIPAGALYLSGADSTSFSTWYQLVIRGARPDLATQGQYNLAGAQILNVDRNTHPPPHQTSSNSQKPGDLDTLLNSMVLKRPVALTLTDLHISRRFRLRADLTTFRYIAPTSILPMDDRAQEVLAHWDRLKHDIIDLAYLMDRQARLIFPGHLEQVGDHFLEMGLLDSALTFYRAGEGWDPDPTRLVRLKRARLEETLQHTPSSPQPIITEFENGLPDTNTTQALAALDLGRWREAETLLTDCTAPPTDAFFYAQARLARFQGNEPQVLYYVRRLHSNAPMGPRALAALSSLWRYLPRHEAESWLRAALSRQRDPSLMVALAQLLMETPPEDSEGAVTSLQEAAALFDVAIREAPDLIEPYVGRGWLRLKQQVPWQAFADSKKALELNPVNPEALRLALALYRRGLR